MYETNDGLIVNYDKESDCVTLSTKYFGIMNTVERVSERSWAALGMERLL